MSAQTHMAGVFEDPELVRMSTIRSLSRTNDSTSTEWGPGTIFGRVLLGFGEAVKDGFDNIIIRRRLNALNSMFSHEQTLPSANLSQIYNDVLELSRPGLYREQIRQQALSILLAQIAVRQTEPLLISLGRWPIIEIQLFLAQIFACMPKEWSQEGTTSQPMYRYLTDVYISAQKQDEIHTALPFLDFLVQICQRSQGGGLAVLDAGLLDLLVSMMVRDFSIPSLGLRWDGAEECRFMMLDVCQSLLRHLSTHADHFLVMTDHPISALWPKHHLFHDDLAINSDARWRKRRLAWKQVDKSLVDDRIKNVPALYETPAGDMADLEDVCVDLLEFVGRPDVYGTELSSLARSRLLECVMFDGCHSEILADVLSRSSYEENVGVFVDIISCLSSIREALGNLTEILSESRFTRRFFLICISASQRSDTVCRALIGCGAVQLLLLVIDDLMPRQLFPPLRIDCHLTDILASSQKRDEIHAAIPFFNFLVQICRSQAGGQVVLDAGLLDLLVSMMVRNFSIPSLSLTWDEECRSMVLDECQSLLRHLSAHVDLFPVLAAHPISALWPKHHIFHEDLTTSADARWRKRRLAWKQVDRSLVDDRLKNIPTLYGTRTGDFQEFMLDLEDVCIDLLEFVGKPDVYGTELSSLARSQLLECIALGGPRCEVLASVLSSSSYEENSNVFKNLISYLSSLREAWPPLHNSTTRSLSEKGFTGPFLLVCISASERSDIVRRALIDSGMVHLLLSVISDFIPNQPYLPLEYEEDDAIPLLLINCEALSREKDPPNEASDTWKKHLCHAVNVLLSIKDVVIHQESQELSEPLFSPCRCGFGCFTYQWNQWRFVCCIRISNPSFITPTPPPAGATLEYTMSIQQRLSVVIDQAGITTRSSSSFIQARHSFIAGHSGSGPPCPQ